MSVSAVIKTWASTPAPPCPNLLPLLLRAISLAFSELLAEFRRLEEEVALREEEREYNRAVDEGDMRVVFHIWQVRAMRDVEATIRRLGIDPQSSYAARLRNEAHHEHHRRLFSMNPSTLRPR